MLRILFAVTTLLWAAAPVFAASSGWLASDGGAVRLVTSGLSDEEGRLRGALEIELKPGWKTYWREPGESGVPPQIDLSGSPDIKDVEILYPAPERISDPYATWAGYKSSVALPVILTLATPGSAGIVEGSLFLGICETVCIPFEASFSFDAGADPDNPGDAAVVEAAFAALPDEAHETFEVGKVSRDEDRLLFHADIPEKAAKPALFIAAPQGLQIATPELVERNGTAAVFSAEIFEAPAPGGGDLQLDYTLVAGDEAVSGVIPLQDHAEKALAAPALPN